MPPIYLDHNATTPLLPAVFEALTSAYQQGYANPSSQHQAGRQARRTLEMCRQQIAHHLGASTAGMDPDRVLFTSGGAEANNHALRGMLPDQPAGKHLILSGIEHPSVAEVAKKLANQGVQVDRLPANAQGVVCVDQLTDLLRPDTYLVSVMLANNETGVLQPVEEIARLCNDRGIPVHTDATQVAGKLPINFQTLGVSLMTLAAHKFHGPHGIGVLVVRGGLQLQPLLWGQADAERPGTPPVELAVGMSAALDAWASESEIRIRRMQKLRDDFERALLRADSQTVVIGAQSPRLPHTSCLAFLGLDRQVFHMALDREGVACSTGSACASGSSEPSPALVAMGLPEEQIRGALRFSLGASTSALEIAEAVRRISSVCSRLRSA